MFRRRIVCCMLVVLSVIASSFERAEAGRFRHRGRKGCCQPVCRPEPVEVVKEVQIIYMCTHKYTCLLSGNAVLSSAAHAVRATAELMAKQNAEQMAMQFCAPGGYRDDGPFGCQTIQVVVAIPVAKEYRGKPIVPPLFECIATCYCHNGRKIIASSINLSPQSACSAAKALAHAVAGDHDCTIRCCRCCVRRYCLPVPELAK